MDVGLVVVVVVVVILILGLFEINLNIMPEDMLLWLMCCCRTEESIYFMAADTTMIISVSQQQASVFPEASEAAIVSSESNQQSDINSMEAGGTTTIPGVLSQTAKVTVTDIMPLPKVQTSSEVKRVTKRKTTKAAILTSSPYKRQLEENQHNQKNKGKKVKYRPTTEPVACARPNPKKRSKKCSGVGNDDDIRNWYCALCKDCLKENMIQCQQCNSWVHCECAGVSCRTKHFICDLCN